MAAKKAEKVKADCSSITTNLNLTGHSKSVWSDSLRAKLTKNAN